MRVKYGCLQGELRGATSDGALSQSLIYNLTAETCARYHFEDLERQFKKEAIVFVPPVPLYQGQASLYFLNGCLMMHEHAGAGYEGDIGKQRSRITLYGKPDQFDPAFETVLGILEDHGKIPYQTEVKTLIGEKALSTLLQMPSQFGLEKIIKRELRVKKRK